MQEEVVIGGKTYVSVKRAAEETGYTRDYIGQLARGGKVSAKRLERVWFVDLPALLEYKAGADAYVPTPPAPPEREPLETIVGFDGKEYISARRASEISRYNQDYVTQLAREGIVMGKQVAGRWYISREDIERHKRERDTQVAAMMVQSSGIVKPAGTPPSVASSAPGTGTPDPVVYLPDSAPLLPILQAKKEQTQSKVAPNIASLPTQSGLTQKGPQSPSFSHSAGQALTKGTTSQPVNTVRAQKVLLSPVHTLAYRPDMRLMVVGGVAAVFLLFLFPLAFGNPTASGSVASAAQAGIFHMVDMIETLFGGRLVYEKSI